MFKVPCVAIRLLAAGLLTLSGSARAQETKEPRVGMMPGVPLGPHVIDKDAPILGFIDSGVQADHPQIKGLIAEEKDFTGEGPGDDLGHGTKVVLVYIAGHYKDDEVFDK